MEELVKRYDERSKIMRSIVMGCLAVVIGLCLDTAVHQFQLRWEWERLIENSFEGIVFGAIVWSIITHREERLKKRFQEIGYMNHHIRNSLATIELAEGYIDDVEKRLDLVRKSSKRIQRCIEKISREEDISGIDSHPEEP